jgi:outer membrane protein assembly factor BamB/serine/threonine protein kinase
MTRRDDQARGSGTKKWAFETGSYSYIISSPTVVDGTAYAGSDDGNLYAVDSATGTEKWVFQTGGWIRSSPTVVDGTVYVGSNDNTLYAVDAVTGNPVWTFETGGWVKSSPMVVDGTVYVGSNDNTLYAVDSATGNQEWAFETGGRVKSSPMVVGGTVYVGSDDHNLYAVDAATGNEEWAFETGGWVKSSPTVVGGTVYVGSYDHNLYAVDAATGNQGWSFRTGGSVKSSPTVVDGTVYVGSNDHNLYAVDAATGNQEWTFETGSYVNSSPTVVNDTVYVGSIDENLYAVDAATGNQEWTFETEGSVRASPTVVDGTVYVGSNDNTLYAIIASAGPENSGDQPPSEPDEKEQIPRSETVRSPKRRDLSPEEFETIETLGGGGQAVINKARLPDSKTPPEVVAVREPAEAGTLTGEPLETFFESAETWATIDAREREKRRWDGYEHIVGVIGTGDSLPWIAMEYMDGGDLAELLADYPNGLPVEQALWIGECVCKGLEIADKLGMAHLDVKPGNVLLKETDGWPWPKLADWGLARNLAKETGTMDGLSVEYAAPEQFDSSTFGDPDQLTDIYQTGALMYALLTGEPPATGAQYEIMQQVMSERSFEPPSEQRSELSAEVDATVGIALEREKTARYDSITEFKKALRAIRTTEPLPRVVTARLGE